MHPPIRIALRHLLMKDAAAGRHPLHVAGAHLAAVAEAVAVLDGAREHVGDGFDPAMRMPRESREIRVRVVVAEVVEQQERIEVARVAETERAPQRDAGAFHGRNGLTNVSYRADGHGGLTIPSYDAERRGDGSARSMVNGPWSMVESPGSDREGRRGDCACARLPPE